MMRHALGVLFACAGALALDETAGSDVSVSARLVLATDFDAATFNADWYARVPLRRALARLVSDEARGGRRVGRRGGAPIPDVRPRPRDGGGGRRLARRDDPRDRARGRRRARRARGRDLAARRGRRRRRRVARGARARGSGRASPARAAEHAARAGGGVVLVLVLVLVRHHLRRLLLVLVRDDGAAQRQQVAGVGRLLGQRDLLRLHGRRGGDG